MTYNNLSGNQVNSVHSVYGLLRKLGVIGRLMTVTNRAYVTESGKPIRYNLVFVSYDPKYKGVLTPEEKISEILANVFRQTD